jgi:hypothetical protein
LATVIIPDSVDTIEFPNFNALDYGYPGRIANSAFANCPKLGIAAQAALKKRGYTASF